MVNMVNQYNGDEDNTIRNLAIEATRRWTSGWIQPPIERLTKYPQFFRIHSDHGLAFWDQVESICDVLSWNTRTGWIPHYLKSVLPLGYPPSPLLRFSLDLLTGYPSNSFDDDYKFLSLDLHMCG